MPLKIVIRMHTRYSSAIHSSQVARPTARGDFQKAAAATEEAMVVLQPLLHERPIEHRLPAQVPSGSWLIWGQHDPEADEAVPAVRVAVAAVR